MAILKLPKLAGMSWLYSDFLSYLVRPGCTCTSSASWYVLAILALPEPAGTSCRLLAHPVEHSRFPFLAFQVEFGKKDCGLDLIG